MRMFKGLLPLLLSAAMLVSPAQAQILLGVFDQPFDVAAPPPGGCVAGPTICVIYRGHQDDGTTRATNVPYTFASQPLGTASADRIVIVAFSSNGVGAGALPWWTVTVNGVTATQAVGGGGAGTRYCELWYASVPSGTSGAIVITPTNTQTGTNYMAMDYWTVSNTTQTTWAHRSGSSSTQANSVSTIANTVTLTSGGSLFTVGRASGVTAPFAFAPDAGLTINSDYIGTVPFGSGHGAANSNGTAGSHVVTMNDNTSTSLCLASIDWAP